ncbi:MAG: diaminopimelate epimerase [Dehalococcoidia bacterium]|nr:MAG: diaminopimelate epimerase [Dehalococcoidia bacterium]
MNFAKLQATGNDFILLDAWNMNWGWSKLAQDICHRHLGIGGDGLILVMASNNADLKMRMLNPDGSEAEACGNGLRCFAKYIIDRQIARGPSLTVETLAGVRKVQVFMAQGKVNQVKASMGAPRFRAEDIPVMIGKQKTGRGEVDIIPILDYPLNIVGRELTLSFVSMGNPHAVNFLSQPVVDFSLSEIGPAVEKHPMFPERVNFEVARVVNQGKIEARVWERGAGETLSCGSGACAIAVVARLKGYIDDEVDIMLPGGTLTVDWDGAGEVYLTGPVEEVFTGEWLK